MIGKRKKQDRIKLEMVTDALAFGQKQRKQGNITLKAQIINTGKLDTGAFDYLWKINDEVVSRGLINSLESGCKAAIKYCLDWNPEKKYSIEFIADPKTSDVIDGGQNKRVQDIINDLQYEISLGG